METTILKYFGTIEKSETLVPIHINNLENVLILESKSPFWGYYDDYPGIHNNASYLYIILEDNATFSELHGALLNAKKTLDSKIDMVHASLQVYHNKYTAIRIRGFKKIEEVECIVSALKSSGIIFSSTNKKLEGANSITYISKYFKVEPLSDELLKDKTANHHAYIRLPQRYTLGEIKSIVKMVRNNWTRHSFDAAPVILCSEKESIDAVRIYSDHVWDKDYLEQLQTLFTQVHK